MILIGRDGRRRPALAQVAAARRTQGEQRSHDASSRADLMQCYPRRALIDMSMIYHKNANGCARSEGRGDGGSGEGSMRHICRQIPSAGGFVAGLPAGAAACLASGAARRRPTPSMRLGPAPHPKGPLVWMGLATIEIDAGLTTAFL